MTVNGFTIEATRADKLGKQTVFVRNSANGTEIHRHLFAVNDSVALTRFIDDVANKHVSRVPTAEQLKNYSPHDDDAGHAFDLAEMAKEIRRTADAAERGESANGSKPTYQRLTCADLDGNDFSVKYLIDGILAERQPCIIGGPKKAIKTGLALDLGISLATGTKFLNKFEVCEASRTLLMSGESGLGTIQETARRIADSKGLTLGDIGGFIVSPDLPNFGDPSHLAALKDFVQGDEIKVVEIDPAYLCMPGTDAGNLFTQGMMLRSITRMLDEIGVTLVIVHHARKSGTKAITNAYAAPELDDLSWAGFSEFARQWILLNRREAYEPGSGEHRLWLSVGGSAGHGGLWGLDIDEGVGHGNRHWSVSLNYSDEIQEQAEKRRDAAKWNRQQELLGADADAIVAALARCMDYTETKHGLRQRTRIANARLDAAISQAIDQGRIEPTTIKKENRIKPYDAYRMTNETT